jgi:hypothetical protein
MDNWSYLLDIMSVLGFGSRWRNWVSTLWATTSSSFLVNGEPGRRICHRRGVRQGDPMLFLLAMEPLQLLFRYAQNSGVLGHLHANCTEFRMSVYADDVVVFTNPTVQDVAATRHILRVFGEASGLITNLEKTEFFPINCQHLNVEQLLGT